MHAPVPPLGNASGCPPGRERPVLERCQHIPVGQSDVGVWMTEAREIVKRGENPWPHRVRQVEQPRATRTEPIRQEVSLSRHLELSVVRMRASRPGRDGRDDGAIECRGGTRVDDREKVAGLLLGVTCPEEQVRSGRGRPTSDAPDEKSRKQQLTHTISRQANVRFQPRRLIVARAAVGCKSLLGRRLSMASFAPVPAGGRKPRFPIMFVRDPLPRQSYYSDFKLQPQEQ